MKIPGFKTDAESFLEQDLPGLDFRQKPLRFETTPKDPTLNMRIPAGCFAGKAKAYLIPVICGCYWKQICNTNKKTA